MLLVKHRFDAIKEILRGKSILDIGCVGLGYQEEDEFWIHGKIHKIARKSIGIDIEEDKIDKIREKGYEVVVADVNKRFYLDETFEVIHAGQVLTYITNFDEFFYNMRKHLKTNGVLILSVTNSHSFKNFVKYTFKKIDFKYTNFQNVISLRHLLDKYGFEARRVEYVEEPSRRKIGKIYQFIFRILPRHLSSHIIVSASLRGSPLETQPDH